MLSFSHILQATCSWGVWSHVSLKALLIDNSGSVNLLHTFHLFFTHFLWMFYGWLINLLRHALIKVSILFYLRHVDSFLVLRLPVMEAFILVVDGWRNSDYLLLKIVYRVGSRCLWLFICKLFHNKLTLFYRNSEINLNHWKYVINLWFNLNIWPSI